MIQLTPGRSLGLRSPLLFGHFIEHFHRQIYGGIYDPSSPFADEDGFREDVMKALRRIHVPILRWPGGCFVSAYHWKKGVGPERTPVFDKAWRVEDPNTFGTDEYIRFCRKIGCEPYICTNAGTGNMEEMSDWVEYCNLPSQGEYARQRIRNGFSSPYGVHYWSIGNENYGAWELGAKDAESWGRLVREAAKLMKHVDPTLELSAAALPDIDWNVQLLKACGPYLDWISIHKYWNLMAETNDFATYEECMAYTSDLDTDIRKVRGLLMAFGLEKRIRIAYDEWNLRGWHHPGVLSIQQAISEEDYLLPRNLNDRNCDYTMADAVFTACFLNTLCRNCDIIGMANFSPAVNTRGCIYTYPGGIVLRSTYHVFDLYTNALGKEILDCTLEGVGQLTCRGKDGVTQTVPALDALCTRRRSDNFLAVALVNKHPESTCSVRLDWPARAFRLITVSGESTEAYNDVDRTMVSCTDTPWMPCDSAFAVTLPPHSVSVVQLRTA